MGDGGRGKTKKIRKVEKSTFVVAVKEYLREAELCDDKETRRIWLSDDDEFFTKFTNLR